MKHRGRTVEPAGFGIYVHWPYCASKCPYCDFNSHVARSIDPGRWLTAYCAELERFASETAGRVVETVFFGGGTPSLMEPGIVAEVLASVQRLWRVANDWEVTLEANPGSVDSGRFAAFRAAGVNRVSLGVQSLEDDALRRLGRLHSAAEARTAFDIARNLFARVSFDLIYARQDQDLQAWRAELREATAMAVDHLSLYQLTIEDGTPFAALHRAGRLQGLPHEDLAADMYSLTQEICEAAGLPAYEVSNHARPGAESRHNMLYWTGGDFLGIGPGAHGRLTQDGQRWATEALRDPAAWLRAAESGETTRRSALSPREQALEYLLMGLRVTAGIDLDRMAALAGMPADDATLDHLTGLGLVLRENRRLRTTPGGRMVLNALATELSAAWNL